MQKQDADVVSALAKKYGGRDNFSLFCEAQVMVLTLVRCELTLPQRQALVSLFADVLSNRIEGTLVNSPLVKYLNKRQMQLGAAEFYKWIKYRGKVVQGAYEKRDAEHQLFTTGETDVAY